MPPVLSRACAPLGSGPARLRALAGRLTTTQCTKWPLGASGSSTTIAIVFVVDGGAVHASGGIVPGPSQVYVTGMRALFANALLVTVIVEGTCESSSAVALFDVLVVLHAAKSNTKVVASALVDFLAFRIARERIDGNRIAQRAAAVDVEPETAEIRNEDVRIGARPLRNESGHATMRHDAEHSGSDVRKRDRRDSPCHADR